MICERCKNPNNPDTTEYIITKGDTKRRTVLCDGCAEVTRQVHKLTGGRAPEAAPSEPEPEVTVDVPPEESEPEAPRRRRG